MKHLILTISLILGATAVSAEDLPAAYDLMSEGELIKEINLDDTYLFYFIK